MSTTLPGLLLERAQAAPSAVVMRFLRRGKWNEVATSQLLSKAAAVGSGLAAVGIGAGDVVAVICEDGPVAFASTIGAQGIGATVLLVDPDMAVEDTQALLRGVGPKAAIVGDQEQYDKIDEARDSLSSIATVAVDATRGLRELERLDRSDQERSMTLAQLEQRGDSSTWAAKASSIAPSTRALIRNNGTATTVTRTQEELLNEAYTLSTASGLHGKDVLYSLHSLADPTDFSFSVAALKTGAVQHFGQLGLREGGVRQVRPTLVHASPRWVGGIANEVTSQRGRARFVKRAALDAGFKEKAPATSVRSGARIEPTRIVGLATVAAIFVFLLVSPSLADVVRILVILAILLVAALVLVFGGLSVAGPLRRRYGLNRCRAVFADNLSANTLSVLGALDVPVVSTVVGEGEA